jgi:hypothetical protein
MRKIWFSFLSVQEPSTFSWRAKFCPWDSNSCTSDLGVKRPYQKG